MLVKQLAEQDGECDPYKEEHDATASCDDADPCGDPLDSFVLAQIGAKKGKKKSSCEDAKDAADVTAQGQVGEKSERLTHFGNRPA